jgi:hypothetical protein
VSVEHGDTVHLSSVGGRPEVMIATDGLDRWADAWVSGMDDRFGRHREARLRLERRGLLLVAMPLGVESLGLAGPDGPGGSLAPAERATPVRQ